MLSVLKKKLWSVPENNVSCGEDTYFTNHSKLFPKSHIFFNLPMKKDENRDVKYRRVDDKLDQ